MKESRFYGLKIGQKVIIKTNLVINRTYGDDVFVGEMIPYLGKVITIKKIDRYAITSDEYSEYVGDTYRFTPEMIDEPFTFGR